MASSKNPNSKGLDTDAQRMVEKPGTTVHKRTNDNAIIPQSLYSNVLQEMTGRWWMATAAVITAGVISVAVLKTRASSQDRSSSASANVTQSAKPVGLDH